MFAYLIIINSLIFYSSSFGEICPFLKLYFFLSSLKCFPSLIDSGFNCIKCVSLSLVPLFYEYFIRFQNEFDLESPFKKENYRGGDVTWKPRLIGLLGFNKELMYEKLTVNSEIKELENTIKLIQKSKVTLEKNRDRINTLENEKLDLEKSLSELNLLKTDKENIKESTPEA